MRYRGGQADERPVRSRDNLWLSAADYNPQRRKRRGATATAVIETVALTRVFHAPRRIALRNDRPARVALDHVSLRVEQGECVALVGPNGAGKTTLLRVLATSISPTSGDALVAGHSVRSAAHAVRREIGVVTGDDRSFFWRLSGVENLVFFGRLQGLTPDVCRTRAYELLERLGLGDAGEERFSGYSTGMRLRLGIARAVLHRPRVLLLDEPTASLDIHHRRQVLDLLRGALRPDGAALIASHDAGLAAALAHRVVRLERGRLVSDRSTQQAIVYRIVTRALERNIAAALGHDLAEVDGALALTITDLGDGHALAAALAGIVAAGGEIVDVGAHSAVQRAVAGR